MTMGFMAKVTDYELECEMDWLFGKWQKPIRCPCKEKWIFTPTYNINTK